MSLPTALQPLAKLLEKDEPKVLVVVGAGISMGATSASHASWLGLLKHGLKHLVTTGVFTERWGNELSDSLNAAFSPFDLDKVLQHAELVEQNLRIREEAFAEWLRAAFRDFKVQPGKNQTFDALRDLQQAGALVLTTNYDNLLSEVTGVPPVTWEEHADFLQVINRRRSGILHIHGHWKRPTSVVLGKSSYERIVGDPDFQTAFKCLLLQWSWLFVGCGDGLDDPNLGPLLEWGKRWGHGKQSDYFLAIADKAQGLANRPDKPPYLVSVGYPDHLALPGILHSLTPSARCRPFIPVDKDFELFRSPASPLSNPFPSQQEYLDGEVPALAADAEVRRRLKEHGWAFVLDVATVGKTTLALRLATSPEQRDHPTYYLDLGTIIPDDADSEVAAAMRRLSRPNSLLILDNVHHLPELARQLWNQWRDRPCGTSLLLVATRIQRTVMTAPAQDLVFFEHHATNPAIKIQSTPEDLGAIVKHLYRRVGGGRAQPLPTPSPGVLQRWYRDYRSALSAFCLAALRCLDEFRRDNWDLPIEAASDWVREKWFDKLNAENQENAICLAVFGAQELEIQVAKEALPYPDKTDQLLRQGLVGRIERGQFGQYHRFSLREPSWGRLILAAVEFPIEKEETILFETAARHPVTTIVLSSRLRSQALLTRHLRFWAYLAVTPNNLVRMVHNLPLLTFSKLVQAAKVGQQPRLAHRFWEALEREPNRLAERAWETPLGDLASFLDTAKRHGRDVTALWVALEREPGKLAEHVWGTSLDHLAHFLKIAKGHGRDVTALWEALEREPGKLAERAWETPLHFVASFLDTAKRHGRDVTALWVALEREPGKLAEHVWGTSLDHLAHFLKIAKGHGRDVTALWEALEREPSRLAERAWETPLGDLASFLDTAKRHGRDATALWKALEREPGRLTERMWETPLHGMVSFLDTAKRHGRDVTALWEALEREPSRLAERIRETPLADLASFLDTAKQHRRDTTPLWEAMESEPFRLAERAWETSLEHLARFLNIAKEHGRDSNPLLQILEGNPERLCALAKQTSVGQLSGFCHYAPATLVKKALTDFPTNHWDKILVSEPMFGAIGVAVRCAEIGREDLKSTLITTLLRRANSNDFPSQGMAFANLAWLLENTPLTASTLIPAFLDALCTNRWLGLQFNNSPCVSLAVGLRLLALHQPLEICRRFHNPSLGIRLQKEFSRFAQVGQQEQSQIIQFLGCATLCGWAARRDWFENVPLRTISALPMETLVHRPDTSKIEEWQFQLWLGLRAVASITWEALSVATPVISQTLELWRSNLEETSLNLNSPEYRVNQSMVAWLERCSDSHQGLLPERMPLWVAVGFPHRLNLPRRDVSE